MAIYMVERQLPGITPEQLAGAQQTAIATSRRFTSEGKEVRYIRSTFVPQEDRCLCLFEAPTRQLVQDVNESARLPFTRIVEALDLTPVVLAMVVLCSLSLAGCGANPVAPSRVNTSSGAITALPVLSASSRPAASCSNVDATVAATLGAGGTATGTISGDVNGPVSAAIHAIDASGRGSGALHVQMEHHYTNTSPFGRIDTSDEATLAPMDKAHGIYRMNNRLTIVGGEGSYAGAAGYFHTHGTVDFSSGSIALSLKGRVCVP